MKPDSLQRVLSEAEPPGLGRTLRATYYSTASWLMGRERRGQAFWANMTRLGGPGWEQPQLFLYRRDVSEGPSCVVAVILRAIGRLTRACTQHTRLPLVCSSTEHSLRRSPATHFLHDGGPQLSLSRLPHLRCLQRR